MIEISTGDMFKSGAEALVNPVNTVGVMGAGLAAQFKKRFPQSYKTYKNACDNGDLQIGSTLLQLEEGVYVIQFPTKEHWKNDSKLEYIVKGLPALHYNLKASSIKSVAIPALGCGLGGLDWVDVETLIREEFEGSDIHVILYPPK